jgi:hypothetical protein
MHKFYEVALCIFCPSLHPSLWWLQSSEISTRGIFFHPQTLAAMSMHDHAPMLVPLIHARSIIRKSNKHILFRQHHILMYVRKSSKKQKYLIVKLLGTSSSDRSLYVFRCRCSGCINTWDVLIKTTWTYKITSSSRAPTAAPA